MQLQDEPTSGLDSMMGELICLHLKGMTRDKHRIIMATIHSPSVRMWSYFNKVSPRVLFSNSSHAYDIRR